MSLQRSLPRIAARILQNTHVGLSKMKEKFELIEEAYGRAAVEKDFERWCQEIRDQGGNPKYPLTEYVKVVDKRFGRTFDEERANTKDPRIAEISAYVYEQSGVLPTAKSVATLLISFSPEEIKSAVREFISTLDEKEYKTGMRTFFAEGSGGAVIFARRQRLNGGAQ